MQNYTSLLEKTPTTNTSTSLYLDLMKRCVTDWIYLDSKVDSNIPFFTAIKVLIFALRRGKNPLEWLNDFGAENIVEKNRIGGETPFPGRAHTMIGFKRLDTLQKCVEDVLENDIPGDFLEAGVWRGGACIFMRAILQAYGIKDRQIWVADSFQGVPAPNAKKYPQDAGWWFHLIDEVAVPLKQVKANFSRYGLLDEQVKFIKGWFSDTLPSAPVEQLAVIRADGDLYESTMDILTNLYPKLSVGGYVIIDDYGIVDACQKAVDDFRQANGIEDELISTDGYEHYWKKTK
ncbi:Demethyldecarbamoylnovobiocin O-methyltransferase [Hyella patelloides LEGE 07179]|uniref:Demethyldecarbamoylnovobiocin O-methyltransferase n=1 Tax=Hyella patelloides LEGE 07179 TaxID=945734 RepID=A0A563W1G4_9CYAN|nr:TylF/MycF/NovP-related O-methyltransferase [Hyella patelloides]VEP17549.1 Demethyldecarbamoylnovobiocin O-methyltransferase [Hyella patelloides LEGE 07179]